MPKPLADVLERQDQQRDRVAAELRRFTRRTGHEQAPTHHRASEAGEFWAGTCNSALQRPERVERSNSRSWRMTMFDDDVVLGIEDLRPLIPVSRKTITNRLRDGRDLPPHFTVGRKTFFRRSAVLAWIEQRERQAQERLSQDGSGNR